MSENDKPMKAAMWAISNAILRHPDKHSPRKVEEARMFIEAELIEAGNSLSLDPGEMDDAAIRRWLNRIAGELPEGKTVAEVFDETTLNRMLRESLE